MIQYEFMMDAIGQLQRPTKEKKDQNFHTKFTIELFGTFHFFAFLMKYVSDLGSRLDPETNTTKIMEIYTTSLSQ